MYRFFFIIFLFAGCNSRAAVVVQMVDPLLKVLPSSKLPAAFSISQATCINDNINFQLALLSISDVNVDLQFSSSSLSHSFLSAFKKYKIELIKVTDRMGSHGSDYLSSPSGLYPDPLIPQTVFSLKKDRVFNVLLDLKVNPGFPVGIHNVNVNVLAAGKIVAKTTFTFQVFTTAVPEKKMSYLNWYHEVKYDMVNGGTPVADFSPLYWKIFKRTVQVAKDYGQNSFAINPMFLTGFTKTGNKFGYDFTNLNKAIDIILNEVKMEYVVTRQLGARMDGWESEFGLQYPFFYGPKQYMMKNKKVKEKETSDFYPDFLKAYYNNFKVRKYLPKILQHLADEPISSNVQSYIEIAQMVKSYAPDLKIIEAGISPKAFKYIDIVVVPLGEVPNLEKELNEVRKSPNKQVWIYTSNQPQGDWANRFIEQPVLKTQLIPWIMYKYKFKGYLHWALNLWGEDPYKDASFPPNNLPGGDSYIVYPGDQTINPSVRFIAMRNGLNDAALLTLLEKTKPSDAKRIAGDLVKGYGVYRTDNVNYHQRKKEILTLLAK